MTTLEPKDLSLIAVQIAAKYRKGAPGIYLAKEILDALREAAPSGQAPLAEVKALEWDRYSSRGGEVANTVVGVYQIVPYHEHFGLIAPGGSLDSFSYAFVGPLLTVKAAAQDDYERRILSALLAPASAEPVAWAGDNFHEHLAKTGGAYVRAERGVDYYLVPIYASPPTIGAVEAGTADESRCRWPACQCFSAQGPNRCQRPAAPREGR